VRCVPEVVVFASTSLLATTVLAPSIVIAAGENHGQVTLSDEGAMMRVPVNVFGKTLYFVVDTGCTVSALDSQYQQLLGGQIDEYSAGTPLGTDITLAVFHCPKMYVADKETGLEKITCLDLKLGTLISGKPCDGILGMDYFSKHVVSINFDENSFSIDDVVPESVKKACRAIPLNRSDKFYSMEALIDHDNHIELMVDTGDASSISLNSKGWEQAFGDNPTNVIITTVADAANQIAQSKLGVIKQLSIGDLVYTNLHTTLIRNPTNASRIGLGFFRRHMATFDFANNMLYLQRGAKFSTPDQEDMSGLHLLRQGVTTFVYSIDENSPASDCGIRPNDIIESLNGQNTVSMTMKNIRDVLQTHDGASITLKVTRGDNVREFAFALKQAI